MKTTKKLLDYKKDNKLSDEKIFTLIGISKGTYYKRIKDHKWSKAEVYFIENGL